MWILTFYLAKFVKIDLDRHCISEELWSWPIYAKGQGQRSLGSKVKEWKQTHGCNCITFHANVVGKNILLIHYYHDNSCILITSIETAKSIRSCLYDAAFSLHIILHHPISLTQNLPLPMGAMDGHLIHYSISPLDATTPNSIYSVLNEKNFIMLHNLILSSA